MIRTHLIQLDYLPAYFGGPVDLLSESSPLTTAASAIGNLVGRPAIRAHTAAARGRYVESLIPRLNELLAWTISRSPDLIVFPEYSIPPECLSVLADHARLHEVTIVAGSHRVQITPRTSELYRGAQLEDVDASFSGAAIVPIFQPDGSHSIAGKRNRSKWEPDLITEHSGVSEFTVGGTRVGILVCIDAMTIDSLARVVPGTDAPAFLVVPAWSPATEPFDESAALLGRAEVPLLVANAAIHGGSGLYVPSPWQELLSGQADAFGAKCPRSAEMICEIDLEPDHLHVGKGAVATHPGITHPRMFPVRYLARTDEGDPLWALQEEVVQTIREGDPEFAQDWLNEFLVDHTSVLDAVLLRRLSFVRDSVLPSAINESSLVDYLTTVDIVGCPPPPIDYSQRVAASLRAVQAELSGPATSDLEALLGALRGLKEAEAYYPLAPSESLASDSIESDPQPTVDVAAFQDRGTPLNELRQLFQPDQAHVIVLHGLAGVGKTELTKSLFEKVLPDWTPVWLSVPARSGVAAAIAAIAHHLGLQIDIDALARDTPRAEKAARSTMKRLAKAIFEHPHRCHVVDDIGETRFDRNDRRLLQIFVDEMAAFPATHGKLMLVSSRSDPFLVRERSGVAALHIGPVRDEFVERIIEFQVRRAASSEREALPSIPPELVAETGGFPLLAKIAAASILASKGQAPEAFTPAAIRALAHSFLQRIDISEADKDALRFLSVFRTPVSLNSLTGVYPSIRGEVEELALRGICDFDGRTCWIHPVIRRAVLADLEVDDRHHLHQLARDLYQESIRTTEGRGFSLQASVELAYHATQCGDADALRTLAFVAASEVFPEARSRYRSHDYAGAMRIFQYLREVRPRSPEVWAYLGRCHARFGHWPEVDECFGKAIEVARAQGVASVGWIYRDWAHILIRYDFFERGIELLEDAARNGAAADPSTQSAKAYAEWKLGTLEAPGRTLADLYNAFPEHSYTIYVYAQFAAAEADFELHAYLLNELRFYRRDDDELSFEEIDGGDAMDLDLDE